MPKSIAVFDALWARVSSLHRDAQTLLLLRTVWRGLWQILQNRTSLRRSVSCDICEVRTWVIMLDGFLLSAGARTQSVIAQSSCEAEYIAATAATSEVKYIKDSVLGLWTTREHPSAFRQLWRHWCGKQKKSATVTSSGRAISVVAGGDRQQEHSNQQGAWA